MTFKEWVTEKDGAWPWPPRDPVSAALHRFADNINEYMAEHSARVDELERQVAEIKAFLVID